MGVDVERLRAAIGERYRIGREIGRGGMATVYVADDLKHDRQVAIKVLLPELAAVVGVDRFLHEIRVTANLQHPHILPLFDSGQADEVPYYVMPFVEGETLRERLDRKHELSVDEAVRIATEVAEALHHAHGQGVVHRDVKPENILLRDGSVLVSDFGIAFAVHEAGGDRLTETGLSLGTPKYMSPEQVTADRRPDAKSDVYSLGAVLYEMLAGEPPFEGGPARSVMARVVSERPVDLRKLRDTVPDAIADATMQALEKLPADRPRDASALARMIRRPLPAVPASAAPGPVPLSTRLGDLFKDLNERRVPQYALLYIGVSWGLVEFSDFLTTRYAWSPAITDFVLFSAALCLPSALLLAWTLGKPGVDRMTRLGRTFLPANLAVAALVLFGVFRGEDLGAMTTTVTVADEEGNEIERVIPKASFRRRLAIFPFDLASAADTSAGWLRYALPQAVGVDLIQEPFIDMRDAQDFRERLVEAGFTDLTGAPLGLKLEIARELHRDHFLTGAVGTDGDEFVVSTTLYESGSAGVVEEREYRGTDVLEVADEIALRLRGDLEIPTGGAAGQTPDLPLSEVLTGSPEAYRAFSEGQEALLVRSDYAEAGARTLEAIELDPTFTAANANYFGILIQQGRGAEAAPYNAAAMEHLYRLPERVQFTIKSNYYFMRGENERAWRILEMFSELYPDDLEAVRALIQVQQARGDRIGMIDSYRRILELDAGQIQLLRQIGGLQESLGRLDEALDSYSRYAELAPEDPGPLRDIGDIHRRRGDHSRAREHYERADLLDPTGMEASLRLARVDMDLGEFDAALARYERVLGDASTPRQRADALSALGRYHAYRGRPNEAIDYVEQALAERETFDPPFIVLSMRLGTSVLYAAAGRVDEAETMIESLKGELGPPFDEFWAIAAIMLYTETDEPDRAEEALAIVERLIGQFGYEGWRPMVLEAAGAIHEDRGEWAAAIEQYERLAELEPTDMDVRTNIGRCLRHLGDLDAAAESIEQALLVQPSHALANYELALVLEARGDREGARERLRVALATWEEAAPAFEPAAEARRALERLGS